MIRILQLINIVLTEILTQRKSIITSI